MRLSDSHICSTKAWWKTKQTQEQCKESPLSRDNLRLHSHQHTQRHSLHKRAPCCSSNPTGQLWRELTHSLTYKRSIATVCEANERPQPFLNQKGSHNVPERQKGSPESGNRPLDKAHARQPRRNPQEGANSDSKTRRSQGKALLQGQACDRAAPRRTTSSYH